MLRSRQKGSAGQSGFTLMELVMTIVILGTLSLILIPFFQSIARSPDPVIRQRGIALGQALMDEILSKKWDHNTPVGGGPICTDESPDQSVRLSLVDDGLTCASSAITGLGNEHERGAYQAVSDYDGHDEEDDFWDQNQEPFRMAGYRRQVQVRYIDSDQTPPQAINHDTPSAATATTDTKLIVVTIETPTGETFHFVSAVCNL